jgi:hypothetical protein
MYQYKYSTRVCKLVIRSTSLESFRSPGALRRQLIKPPSLHHTGRPSSLQLPKEEAFVRLQEVELTRMMVHRSRISFLDFYAPLQYSSTTAKSVGHESSRQRSWNNRKRRMKQSPLPTTVLICREAYAVMPFFYSFILLRIPIDGPSRDTRSWRRPKRSSKVGLVTGHPPKKPVFLSKCI